MLDPQDTIVALATPRGGALRGIVRVTGPRAWQVVGPLFCPPLPQPSSDFGPEALSGHLSISPLSARLPATLYLSRGPRSFTGQDLAELHTFGSPPILEQVLGTLVSRGARQAIAGEFTLRAFIHGKLDLTAAEAIGGLIDANTPRQAAVALEQLAGGIARPIAQLRERLLDLLAELEAGLDFAEEDLEFIARTELRASLESACGELARLRRQIEGRSTIDERYRAVLLGPPNAGKSSLFNALLGRDAALVSRVAGTTRDYLVGPLKLSEFTIDLVDTAGIEQAADPIGQKAQLVRDQIARDAELLLWCMAPRDRSFISDACWDVLRQNKHVLLIQTKQDLASVECGLPAAGLSPMVRVSSVTGFGLNELRRAIEAWLRASDQDAPAVVPSTAARCRQAIALAQAATDRALRALASGASDECIALELRIALDELGLVVGAVCTDDILDRVFSRFCVGK